jgi:spore maturation protein CgeB
MKQQQNCCALHYTLDAHFFYNKSRHFQQCISLYDWVITTKPFERKIYQNFGAHKVLFVLQGYDPRFSEFSLSTKDFPKWKSDVCFVGHCQVHYAARIKSANETTKEFRVWGQGWEQYSQRHTWARKPVCGNGVWGDDYLKVLASAKIALGLLGKHIPETTTTRSFEIPAMGTFMLAERTDDHLALFEEGKEAEFFESDDEMKNKIKFYLNHERARKKIAAAGRKRCLRSGYSSSEQLSQILTEITL